MKFNPFEFHHLYWGALLIIAAVMLIVFRCLPWLAAPLLFAGIIMVADDINQHWGNGTSPLHDLFCWAWGKVFGNWWPFGNLK